VPIPSVRAAPRLSLIDQPDPFCTSTAPVVESGTHRQARCSGRARCGAWGRSSCTGCSVWPHFPPFAGVSALAHTSSPRVVALPRPSSSSLCTSPPCCRRRRGLPRSLVVIILHFPALLSSASGTSSLARCRHYPFLPRPAVASVGDFLSRCRHHLALPRSVVVSVGASSVVVVIILHFPALSSSASASYCAECHSLLLSATPSAPSPQSGFTDNEVWRGPFARRLSP